MEFLSLRRRCLSWQNVPSGEERGEMAVFAGRAFEFRLSLTFGTKRRHSVSVVQNNVRNDVRANCVVGRSRTSPTTGITRMHGMMTL